MKRPMIVIEMPARTLAMLPPDRRAAVEALCVELPDGRFATQAHTKHVFAAMDGHNIALREIANGRAWRP